MTNQPANPNALAAQAPTGFPIVGIGTTGDITALEQLFQAIPEDNGLAFVIVTHLPAHRNRKLGEILQQSTRMPVIQADDAVMIQPDHVYVAPAGRPLRIKRGILCLDEPDAKHNRRGIDIFLQALAADQGANAIAVILSGTGIDGVQGLAAVKAQGGFTLAQTPEEAEQAELPRRALATNQVDVHGSAHVLAQQLLAAKGKLDGRAADEPAIDEQPVLAMDNETLNAIIAQLHMQTGHDLSHYKPSTILRRITRRLQIHAIDNLSAYLVYLRQHPEETQALFKDCLISVTNFFRDPEDFAALEKMIIPQILTSKKPNETVRIWVTGCATGEEAYSLALLFYEHAAQMSEAPHLQIFATDLDEEAINVARRGLYPESIASHLTPLRLQRFFSKENEGYRVKLELREIVLFAIHNLLKDPPFSKLDLISCRNLLIYFNREAQEKTFELFHYALNGAPAEPGYLFLGTSESADAVAQLFSIIDKRHHLFQRRATIATPRRLPPNTLPLGLTKASEPAIPAVKPKAPSVEELYQQWTLRHYAPPRVLVNENYEVTHLFNGADRYLREREGAVTQNILLKVLPELRLDLRAALYQALNKGERTDSRLLRVQMNKEWCLIQLHVGPVPEPGFPKEYVEVVFEERQETAAIGLPTPDTSTDVDSSLISRLEEELLRTRDRLQTIIEEHEIANQELKASNEELQSINEELKSTTEELETSKEELQSMNEELVAVNHELKLKIEELGRVNSDLLNLMASTDVGAVFLDQSLRIKRFTPRATELFHLIETDIGRPFAHISHRLHYTRLVELTARVLSTLAQIEEVVQSDDERWYIMRMFPYRTMDNLIDGVVTTFIDITDLKRAEHEIKQRIQQQVVAELGRQALQGNDLNALLRLATQRVAETLEVEFAKVLEAQPDSQTLRFKAGVGWSAMNENEATLSTPDNTQSWYTFHEDQPVIVENIKQEKRFQPSPMLSAHQIVSGVTVVIPGRAALYGVLGIYSREARTFTSYEVDFLQAVANLLAEAIVRAATEQQIHFQAGLLDAVEQGVIATDLTGKIIYWNRFAEQLYGWRANEVQGRNIVEITPSNMTQAQASAIMDELRNGASWSGEFTVQRRAGTTFPAQVIDSPIYAEDGTLIGFVGVSVDISERKAAEASLRRQSNMLEQTHDAIFMWDVGGSITYWNQGAERLYGYTKAEAVGQRSHNLLQTVHPQPTEHFEMELEQIGEWTGELQHTTKAGRVITVLSRHQLYERDGKSYVLETSHDITERKETEQALYKNNILLRGVISGTNDGIYVRDRAGHYLLVNTVGATVVGLTPEQMIGKQYRELFSSAVADAIQAEDAPVLASGEMQRNETFSLIDDVMHTFHSVRTPYRDFQGNIIGVLNVVRDISDRKQIEETLRESVEQLQLATMAANMGLWFWNLQTDSLIWTAQCKALFGLAPDDNISYARFLKILHPQDRARTDQAVQQTLRQREEYNIEYRAVWPDASIHWISARGRGFYDEAGHPIRMVGVVFDISERKQAEEKLRENALTIRQQLAEIEAIYATTPVGLAVLDRNLRQVRINEQLAAINGSAVAEQIGRTSVELVPVIANTLDAQLQRVIETGEPLINLEITGITPAQPDVERTWVGSFYPLPAINGQVSGINVVVQEITDRKRYERELQELNKTLELRVAERTAELEQRTQELMRRNRELDQFAYVASHDLKAPLRAIDNLSGWIVQDVEALLPASSKEHLAKLRGRVRRMEKLLDDLLAYSRADRYQYASEIIEIGVLISEIIKLFTLPEGFNITVHAEKLSLHTERVPLELVLRNLINNAIKHHHKNGQQGGYVQITVLDNRDFVEFAVADNGPGIAPQFHERIFQMFQTLKPRDQVEGSGMGLAIVKKIVESRGGTISVESDDGLGATFRFTWPK